MKESEIQKCILDYLAAKGILAFRMNSSFTVAEYKGKRRAFRSGVPGMADVLAFPHSRWATVNGFEPFTPMCSQLWIECKAPKGKQSELQASFQKQVEAHGHRYIVAKSLDDVIAAL